MLLILDTYVGQAFIACLKLMWLNMVDTLMLITSHHIFSLVLSLMFKCTFLHIRNTTLIYLATRFIVTCTFTYTKPYTLFYIPLSLHINAILTLISTHQYDEVLDVSFIYTPHYLLHHYFHFTV